MGNKASKVTDGITTMHIDDFATECGYFNGATDANNGYGCNHPEQEEYEMLYLEDGYTHRGYDYDDSKPKTKQGKCYAFSCPLAAKCYTIEGLRELDAQEAESIIQENPNATEEELDDIVASLDLMIVKVES